MDKTRILTGLALAVMMLVLILSLSTFWMAVVLLVFFLAAANEWAALTGLNDWWKRSLYLVFIFACAAIAWESIRWNADWLVITIGCIWWLFATGLLWLWQPSWDRILMQKWMRWAAPLTLIPAWTALVLLHRYDPWLMVYLVALAALADSAAYFVGKRYGKHKMAPALSPGKTWEGAMGEWAIGLVMAIIGAFAFVDDSGLWRSAFFGVVMMTTFVSIGGDLFESLLKRVAGVKDSGHILPGHGGVLDRLDSHLAAAPIFLLGMWLLGGHVQ